jgi:hypothetical protein
VQIVEDEVNNDGCNITGILIGQVRYCTTALLHYTTLH